MTAERSDALVFFGATGDLAHKKIFPALQAMVRRGNLNVPVIGVAKAGWDLDHLKARARDSVENHGGLDPVPFAKLLTLRRYVDGDYNDATTFAAIRKELGQARHPAHYLAIPPSLFGLVVEQLAKAECTTGARVIVEKPFGRDLKSAQDLNTILLTIFNERSIFRIDHYLGKQPVHTMLYYRFTNAYLAPFWDRDRVESVQLTMAENFGVQGRGAFYDQVGTIRDVVQNHLFQVLANLVMEPPVRSDSESIRDEKVKVLKAIPTLRPQDVVRGQFTGYQSEPGVAKGSRVETFAALRLEVNSWRWQGVPFFIRAGKCLNTTCTEIVLRLRKPPRVFPCGDVASNYLRFRIGPVPTVALGTNVMVPDREFVGESREILASEHPRAGEMDAYERVLTDAMAGDATLFAREDYVEEAWRIVDDVMKADTPVLPYAPGSWGPPETGALMAPPGGWFNPVVTGTR